MALGGGDFCDDCAWPDCQGVGFCLRPFASPMSLLGLPLSQGELLELADELAAPASGPVWIGYDPASPDEVVLVKPTDLGKTTMPFETFVRLDHASLAHHLATVSLTGAGESPVVATAMPAVPLRSDDGDLPSEFSTQGSPPAIERPAAEARTALALVGGGTPPSSTASPVHVGTQC